MKKLSCTKLRSFLFPKARSQNEGSSAGSLRNKLTVNEEYKEAFRTESYVEMWTELQSKLIERRNSSSITTTSSESGSSSSSSSSLSHLSDYLFRPPPEQETIAQLLERFGGHDSLLIEYFESNLVACDICEMLLRAVHSTRAHYNKLKRVIKLAKRVKLCNETGSTSSHNCTKVSAAMYRDLTGYAMHTNPLLSLVGPVRFEQIHDNNTQLLRELTRKRRSIQRRAKVSRILKKVGGCTVVIIHTTLMVTLLVIALHSLAGILVVPTVISCFGGSLSRKQPKQPGFGGVFSHKQPKQAGFKGCLSRKKLKQTVCATSTDPLGLCMQLDIAAKGMFFLINDFDSISRLVMSLSNEVEHRKVLAGMCVRNKNGELLKQVVKELCAYDDCYSEQLDELEEHVYLCFHTINRSRRFLLQEFMKEGNKGFDHDDVGSAEKNYLKDLPDVFHRTGFSTKKTKQDAISLFSCLEAFLREEPLGPDDMWYCPNCKEHRQATKKLDLWKLPEILVVHMKRFSYSRFLKNKLDTYVDFPIHSLDLSKYVKKKDGDSCMYELYAISNHYGGLGGGHYTAYAKLTDEDRWYNFDDSRVTPVDEAEIKTSAAYVLFYRRVKAQTQ